MSDTFVLILIFAGICGFFWLIGAIIEWNDERKRRIREEVTQKLIQDSDITEKIEKYKKQLELLGFMTNEIDVIDKKYNQCLEKIQQLIQQQRQRTPRICPRCQNNLRLVQGKYGYFWGCSSFPNCRYTLDFRKAEIQFNRYKKEAKNQYIRDTQKSFLKDMRKALN